MRVLLELEVVLNKEVCVFVSAEASKLFFTSFILNKILSQ